MKTSNEVLMLAFVHLIARYCYLFSYIYLSTNSLSYVRGVFYIIGTVTNIMIYLRAVKNV